MCILQSVLKGHQGQDQGLCVIQGLINMKAFEKTQLGSKHEAITTLCFSQAWNVMEAIRPGPWTPLPLVLGYPSEVSHKLVSSYTMKVPFAKKKEKKMKLQRSSFAAAISCLLDLE